MMDGLPLAHIFNGRLMLFNSLLDQNILALSEWKEFEHDNLILSQLVQILFKRVEKVVEKG